MQDVALQKFSAPPPPNPAYQHSPKALISDTYNDLINPHCIGLTPMRQFTTTTTQRNQVTIPAEVRRILGINPRDKVSCTSTSTNTGWNSTKYNAWPSR